MYVLGIHNRNEVGVSTKLKGKLCYRKTTIILISNLVIQITDLYKTSHLTISVSLLIKKILQNKMYLYLSLST